jgi:hypothetical protein
MVVTRQGMVPEPLSRPHGGSEELHGAAAQVAGEQEPQNWARAANGQLYKTINPQAGNAVRIGLHTNRWWEVTEPAGPQSILPPDHPNHPLNRR